MSRSSWILLVFALVVVSASAWLLLRPRHALPSDPLAAVPDDAYGVLSVRVERVLASPAWQQLVVARGQARGIERVTKTCGFNPLEKIEQLTAFARPAAGARAIRFAFAAQGSLSHARLIDCARKLGSRDGLSLAYEEIEGIQTVRSEKGSSRVALLARGGVMGGDADAVREAILALRGKRRSLTANARLHGLYQELSSDADLVAVAHKPAEVLPLVGRAGALVDPSVLALDKVLALGARVAVKADALSGSALVITQSPSEAQGLARFLDEQRQRVLAIPLIGLTGVNEPLRGARIEASGQRAQLSASITLRLADALLDLVL